MSEVDPFEQSDSSLEIAETRHVVRALAVFQRLFQLFPRYAETEDRQGLCMASWLSRALH